MKKLNIVFFSGNRAEYGMMRPFIKSFQNDPFFNSFLIVSGSHLKRDLGSTYSEIKKDKIKNIKKIYINSKTNTLNQSCEYFNILQKQINNFLKKNRIDIFFLFSDRFETMSVAVTAYLNKIPIIHYEGGDKTEGGTLDDNLRHSITKLSNIHLTSNKDSYYRIIKFGEEKWRVINVGYSTFLNFNKSNLLSNQETINKFNLDFKKKLILFTMHPLPLKMSETRKEIKETLKALIKLDQEKFQIIATYPNFDPGYKIILKELNKMKKRKNFQLFKSLGTQNYHSLLNYIGSNNSGICLGNSSSGIKEPVFFKCKSINIGSRQNNRVKTKNVTDIKKINHKYIYNIILKKINGKFNSNSNPYAIRLSLSNIKKKIFKLLKKKNINFKKCTY